MTIIKTIEKEILDECKEDHVCFSMIISWVKRAFKTELNPKVRRIVLDLIYRNLIDENFVAGQFNQKLEFEIWDLSPEQILARIEKEWGELGRDPDLYDICFFRTQPFDRFDHVPLEERKKMGLDLFAIKTGGPSLGSTSRILFRDYRSTPINSLRM